MNRSLTPAMSNNTSAGSETNKTAETSLDMVQLSGLTTSSTLSASSKSHSNTEVSANRTIVDSELPSLPMDNESEENQPVSLSDIKLESV